MLTDLTDLLNVLLAKRIVLVERSDNAVHFWISTWNSVNTFQTEYGIVCHIEGGGFIRIVLALY